jgi:hypothetical protein
MLLMEARVDVAVNGDRRRDEPVGAARRRPQDGCRSSTDFAVTVAGMSRFWGPGGRPGQPPAGLRTSANKGPSHSGVFWVFWVFWVFCG